MASTQNFYVRTADRISNLPGNIIDSILASMPLQDAVRTSILSKKWGYKWATIPHLHFDWKFENSLPENWKLEDVIESVLRQHKGNVVQFSITGFKFVGQQSTDSWLCFLKSLHVENLALVFSEPGHGNVRYTLHSVLFSFEDLTHLTLHNIHIVLPSVWKGLTKLVKIELHSVTVKFEELGLILSKCPMLEDLEMNVCEDTTLWSLSIDAPNLKRFNFWGYFRSIHFASRSLEEIFLLYHFGEDAYNNFETIMIQIFSQVPSIKSASFDFSFLKCLTTSSLMHKLPNSINHLTSILVESIEYGSKNDLMSILFLLRSSPNVQRLHLTTFDVSEDDDGDAIEYLCSQNEYLSSQKMSNDTSLSSLTYVSIFGITGTRPEMEFIKLILLCATQLEKLEIQTDFEIDYSQRNDRRTTKRKHRAAKRRQGMIRELKSFHWASTKAVLSFK